MNKQIEKMIKKANDNMNTSLQEQIGGSHYKDLGMQPIELAAKLRFSTSQGFICKYITRYGNKNGEEDIRKALHMCELALAVNDFSIYMLLNASILRFRTKRIMRKYALLNRLSEAEHDCIFNAAIGEFELAYVAALRVLTEYTGPDAIRTTDNSHGKC